MPFEGTSLMAAFSGKRIARKQPIFFMHEGNRAVRDGKWKLVAKYMDPWELYDLDADRTELRDLAAQQPAVVQRLSAAYEAWAKRTHSEAWSGGRHTDWGQQRQDADAAKKKGGKKKAAEP